MTTKTFYNIDNPMTLSCGHEEDLMGHGCMMCVSMVVHENARMRQMLINRGIDWRGEEFDGVIREEP